MLRLRVLVARTPLTLAVLGAALAMLLTVPAEARPRPTVDNPNGDDCFNDPGTDKGTNSAIAYCCYDDGCYICGVTPLPGDACVWDGKYRFVDGRGLTVPRRPLNVSPITPTFIKPISPELGPALAPPAVAP
jgi:hypothetical protein